MVFACDFELVFAGLADLDGDCWRAPKPGPVFETAPPTASDGHYRGLRRFHATVATRRENLQGFERTGNTHSERCDRVNHNCLQVAPRTLGLAHQSCVAMLSPVSNERFCRDCPLSWVLTRASVPSLVNPSGLHRIYLEELGGLRVADSDRSCELSTPD